MIAEQVPTETLLRLNRATIAGRLISTVIHDLNNSLLVIGSSVELMEDGPLTEQQRPRLDRIERQQLQMAEVLRELTTVIKPDEGDRKSDLAAVLAQACQLRGTACRRLGIQVRLPLLDGAPCHVPVPAYRVLQILLNLLLNAEAALAEAPVRDIECRLERDPGMARLVIVDTGPGFPASVGEGLFAPFTTSTPDQSAGLGLFAARVLAEQGGGTLVALNTTGGAQVELALPICPEFRTA